MQPRIRIVAMTGGSSHMGDEYCAKLADAIDGRPVLLKPFNAQELRSAVEKEMSSGDVAMARWYGFGCAAGPSSAAPDATLLSA